MSSDLRDRLKRLGKLGVRRGAAHLKSNPQPVQSESAPVKLSEPSSLWNLELPTPFGPAFLRRTCFPLDYRHGDFPLDRALGLPPSVFRDVPGFDARDALFLDTETTGLSGGAGTLAFLVGVGYFDGGDSAVSNPKSNIENPKSFVVDQFFLPDPAGEAGMLCALDRLIDQRQTLVTFNGRAFDAPLLETRYALARIPPALSEKAHLDLLLPSRRLWRYALPSRSLGSIEYHILAVRRDQQDIAGFLIPELYRQYLKTGRADDMDRVMYHNLFDVLSMVTLTHRIADALAQPSTPAEHLSVAVDCERNGDIARAEAAYRAVLQDAASGAQRAIALRRLARCMKRQQRRADALPIWQTLAEQADADDMRIEALVEIARHYEWHAGDLPTALTACQRALALCRQPAARAELARRAARLERKLRRAAARSA
ncbi:MAG: ribonuclease H-like domain-containing protein [Anaerolineae bacterium]